MFNRKLPINARTYLRYLSLRLKLHRDLKSLGFIPKIRNTDDSLAYILSEKCSVSRFGDGEFNFLKNYGPLSEKLARALREPIPNHVTCIPYTLVNMEHQTFEARLYWLRYFCNSFDLIKEYVRRDQTYLDSMLSRFYFSYRDKSKTAERFKKIKELWANQDVLLVEGHSSRLGLNTDLLDGARSIRRILCPTKNAFKEYDRIEAACHRQGLNRLILLALGQTATALSYDLARDGLYAVDIGHVDDEYEWFLAGVLEKTQKAECYRRKRLRADAIGYSAIEDQIVDVID